MIADGDAVETGLATASGVYTRLAALEMLLFPTAPPGGGLIGSVTAALGITGAPRWPDPPGSGRAIADGAVRLGPGPHRAGARHRLVDHRKALRFGPAQSDPRRGADHLARAHRQELPFVDGPLGTVATMASSYSQELRQALAWPTWQTQPSRSSACCPSDGDRRPCSPTTAATPDLEPTR